MDRLRADRPQPDLKAALEPAGYLFGRPVFGQTVQNKALQFNVPLKDRGALAAKHVAAIGVGRSVGSVLMSATAKLATDRRFMPSNGPPNRSGAEPQSLHLDARINPQQAEPDLP